MLLIENLIAAYGPSTALHGVSLSVGNGEVVCLIGRNGVGKTSTMRSIVNDVIVVTGGRITFDNGDLAGLRPDEIIRRGIGYVPEDRRVFPSMSVLENLKVPAGTPRSDAPQWTLEKVFALFPQLKEYRHRRAGVLSGGEQQMLSIGRTLLTNPRLLLLDEPHEGLAPKIAGEVIEAVMELKRAGVSMLISEQSLKTIRECADRVYVIDRGQTVFDGTVAQFEADPEIARKHLMVG
jgi:branched-chain amino acid transport system ATP-binding protein